MSERIPMDLTPAEADVIAERRRQVNVEGWTPEHDDEHVDGDLASAGACYAMPPEKRQYRNQVDSRSSGRGLSDPDDLIRSRPPEWWPKSWAGWWWKPKDRRRDLVRAAALIIAEVERMDRSEQNAPQPQTEKPRTMTKLFELTEQESRLTNVNHRVEKFGEENVLACDLALSFTTANDFLSQLHPTLKWSLYDRPATPDLADHDDHMPLLRYPKIERLAWDQEWTNCELTIHRLKDDIKLVDCKVNKIRIEPQQGGSVNISFRVQFHPDDSKPATLGKLDAMLKDGVVMISLARPLDSEEPVQTNTPEANPVEKAAADLAKSKSFGANGRRRGAAVSAPE